MATELHQACDSISVYICCCCFTHSVIKRCSGALEELVSSHKAVLQVKEQQVLHLEEKERQLQQEVWSLILIC